MCSSSVQKPLLSLACIIATVTCCASEPASVIELCSGQGQVEKVDMPEEADITKPTDNKVDGRPVMRLGNVSKPTISVYRPSGFKTNGAAVMVCPGGAYHILAMDLEGTEVCD